MHFSGDCWSREAAKPGEAAQVRLDDSGRVERIACGSITLSGRFVPRSSLVRLSCLELWTQPA